MRKTWYNSFWTFFLAGFLLACGNSTVTDAAPSKNEAQEPVPVENTHVPAPSGKYADLLKKFKPISFDTLKVEYYYGMKGKKYLGTELTLKEAKSLNIEYTEPGYGKLSGVFACYQFIIDSMKTGLIARIPAEYESTTVGLFILDRKKDKVEENYFILSLSFGDAGDAAERVSWLFRTKDEQFQSFVYDYSSYYHGVEDTTDETVDEWRSYFVINCMSAKFDTISKNEAHLKKRFKRLLKTEE